MMKLKDLLAGLAPLSATADPETEISHISYDSRTTAPSREPSPFSWA